MARMMRSRSWVKVTNTYGADYSGSFRGRERLEARQLTEEWSDEIDEDRKIRELRYDSPKPPSRERRMPE